MKGRDLIENRNHESTFGTDSVTKGLSNNSWNCRSLEDDSAEHGNKKGKRSLRKSILSKCFSGKVKNQNRSIDMQIKSCETSINHPIVREFPGNTLTCSWFILLLLQNVSHYLFLISTRASEHSGLKNVADDKVFTILRKHFWSPSRKLFGGTGGAGWVEDREKRDEMKI